MNMVHLVGMEGVSTDQEGSLQAGIVGVRPAPASRRRTWQRLAGERLTMRDGTKVCVIGHDRP